LIAFLETYYIRRREAAFKRGGRSITKQRLTLGREQEQWLDVVLKKEYQS
jgi:hypothetical protein